jgi:hypothetical protein
MKAGVLFCTLTVYWPRRKRIDAWLSPKIERYVGPRFRVLRRYVRVQPERAVDAFVRSAKWAQYRQSSQFLS